MAELKNEELIEIIKKLVDYFGFCPPSNNNCACPLCSAKKVIKSYETV